MTQHYYCLHYYCYFIKLLPSDRSDEIDKALESLTIVDTNLGLGVGKKVRANSRSTSVNEQVSRYVNINNK